MKYTEHYSVLKKECIQYLSEGRDLNSSLFFADLTFGAGGHTFELSNLGPKTLVVSTDQDPDAFRNGQDRILKENKKDSIILHKTNFEHFLEIVREHHQEILDQGGFDGILMDLGVSSHHFDSPERGFSFRFDGPLDMRMSFDSDDAHTAADILNEYSEEDIANIIYEYGEERFSRRIASKIVERRNTKRFETTRELEEICFTSYPKHMRHKGAHPVTRTFQALRIFVNRELDVLKNVLPDLFKLLKPSGRLAVISFHSLEDRIVKRVFKAIRESDKNMVNLLTKKPIVPGKEELDENNRSRSAKLRVIEKSSGVMDDNKSYHKKKKPSQKKS